MCQRRRQDKCYKNRGSSCTGRPETVMTDSEGCFRESLFSRMAGFEKCEMGKCGMYGLTTKECRSSSHEGAEKPQCAQCGKKHHGQCWIRNYTSSHKDSQEGGWKGDRKGNGKGTQKGGKRS